MAFKEDHNDMYLPALIILCAGAFMLMVGAVYLIQIFSVLYGAGLGAGTIIQSLPSNINVSQSASTFVSQTDSLHRDVLQTYVLFLVSILMCGMASLMFLRYYDTNKSATIKKYALPYVGFILIYALLLYVEVSPFYGDFQSVYMYVVYAGLVITLLSCAYLEYLNRRPAATRSSEKMKSAISIDPAKPFSNAMDIQNELFSKMSGHMRIVDKHFNSVALANLHRLIDRSIVNFNKITILSSKEMLDSDFTTNLADFRNELNEAGVMLEVRLMDEKDAIEQHERILMDDKTAYKVPPFNIINKRSEHITKIGFNDAQKRFSQIQLRAIKLENYAVKMARDEQHEQQAPQTP